MVDPADRRRVRIHSVSTPISIESRLRPPSRHSSQRASVRNDRSIEIEGSGLRDRARHCRPQGTCRIEPPPRPRGSATRRSRLRFPSEPPLPPGPPWLPPDLVPLPVEFPNVRPDWRVVARSARPGSLCRRCRRLVASIASGQSPRDREEVVVDVAGSCVRIARVKRGARKRADREGENVPAEKRASSREPARPWSSATRRRSRSRLEDVVGRYVGSWRS